MDLTLQGLAGEAGPPPRCNVSSRDPWLGVPLLSLHAHVCVHECQAYMHACLYMHLCECLCLPIGVHVCVHLCECLCLSMCVHVWTYIHLCKCLCLCVCSCACACVNACVYMCVHVHEPV